MVQLHQLNNFQKFFQNSYFDQRVGNTDFGKLLYRPSCMKNAWSSKSHGSCAILIPFPTWLHHSQIKINWFALALVLQHMIFSMFLLTKIVIPNVQLSLSFFSWFQESNSIIFHLITQKLCALDPFLVKPKCVWEVWFLSCLFTIFKVSVHL